MGKFIDLKNKKFGRLTVIGRNGYNKQGITWLCKCSCGKEKIILGMRLREGQSKSCGCFAKEKVTKHGMCYSSTYNIWKYTIQRCTNKNAARFKDYGMRINICDRWNSKNGGSFENFLEDMGERPSEKYSLDRIDNDKGYCKENCRWATSSEQSFNKRNNIKLFYDNKIWCRTELARKYNIRPETLKNRINKGMPIEEALTKPLPKQKRKKSIQDSYDEMFKDIKFPIPNTHPLWKFINV